MQHYRPVTPLFLSRTLALFLRRADFYVLNGDIALAVGYSLAETEYHMALLVTQGAIRELTKDEKYFWALPSNVLGYQLMDLSRFNSVT